MGSGSLGYSTTTMVLMMESEHYPQLEAAVTVIHLGFPALSFLYFGLATIITVCTLQTQSLRIRDQQVRRNVILTLILAVAGTYIIEAITLAVKCYNSPESNFSKDTSQDRVVYLLASTITFGLEALALSDAKFPVWYPYYGTWFFGIAAEITLVILTNFIQGPPKTPYQYVFNAIRILRVCLFLILPGLYFGLRNDRKEYDNADAERQALLNKKFGTKASSSEDSTTKSYGATSDTTAQDSESSSEAESEDSWLAEQRKAQALISKRLKQDGNWFTYAKGFAIFFPYLWPVHSKTLQFRAVLVGVCLLASNAMNVLVPRQLGKMIDSLTDYDSKSGIDIWSPVVIYAVLVFISGGACIGWIRKWLWLPVEQYSYDALSTASHAHLMSLSSDFHDNKSSADLTQAVSGGRSVSNLLDTVCFSIVPMFIDLIIAFGYLSALFGPYMGLILVVEAIAYLYTTTKLVSLRAEKRREYVAIYRKEWTVGQQSLDGWTTASLFNQIPYERHRYSCAVKEHMDSKRTYELSSQSITASQGAVMAIGLLGALSLGVYQVAYSGMSVGKLTQLLVYWGQLQSPLSFFSNMYRNISYSLMDAERLLELFQTKPTITDHPKAKPLNLVRGEVIFNNVSFAYDERKPTLKNVSFVVPSGKTVALVGETGGGKTTILKLIDRFYDCKSGGISIDGQDIRDVTLDSLRSRIGVVPQDPMMFHDSVMNNIRYARLTASDEDVYKACKAAALHDKIMSFPDGYNSKVGDRGVKLSGGEKQRVAIARAMLKEPDIILLDEATSAVDTETESQIQEGFKTLCKDRTTFIVAHRLSTVMRADHILVVMNGEIVEQGSHYELIHKKGKYHDLWSRQIFVMPNNDRARSKSPKKRDADLINDLTPGRRTVELAKALKTTEHSEVSCSAESQEGGTTTVAKPADNKTHGDHQREGSKLKPDAPEFVPHVQFESPVHRRKSESKPTKNAKDEKNERKGDSLKGGKKGNRGEANRSSNSEASQSTDPSNIPVVDGYVSGEAKKPKLRHVRSSRRQNAKSEPPNQSRQSMDGAQESDMTPVGSIEGQLLLPGTSPQQKRRVSAPSDPPAGAQDSRKRRPRRGRHWRLKNRVADRVGSSLSGAMSSGDASMDYAATPAPPTTTPEEGVLLINPTLSLAPSA